jgi:PTS system N-acetylgalactosamine-specific IIA component
MIGLIVTGHGKFGSGMAAALDVIAGLPENFAAVDFGMSDSSEELTEKLEAVIDSMQNTDGILILADLAGGTPFKTAVEVGFPRGIEVVAGTNLGMLLEVNSMRSFETDAKALAKSAVEAGKSTIVHFEFKQSK